MKLRRQIVWWFPGGLRLSYHGKPMTRATWIRLTWRGYIAMWHLLFRVAYLLNQMPAEIELGKVGPDNRKPRP